MMPRTSHKSIAMVVAAALASVPCSAAADTGATSSPIPTPTPTSAPAPGAPISLTEASQTVSAEPPLVISTGTLTLHTSSAALEGQKLAFSGRAPARYAQRTVTIERYDRRSGVWIAAASGTIDSRGGFLVRWRANLSGRIAIRALIAGNARAAALGTAQSAEITIYRPALATYFGPGFYDKQTACGQTLKPQLVGVANRTLPCGTLVDVSYAGHRLTVPVIDRGPYANGASWDLTQAAARALGISETVHIGTLVVGSTANIPTLGMSAEALAAEARTALTGGTAS